jgi:hypothetical protein
MGLPLSLRQDGPIHPHNLLYLPVLLVLPAGAAVAIPEVEEIEILVAFLEPHLIPTFLLLVVIQQMIPIRMMIQRTYQDSRKHHRLRMRKIDVQFAHLSLTQILRNLRAKMSTIGFTKPKSV